MFKIIEKLLSRHLVILFQPQRAEILKRDREESVGAKHKELPVNDFPIYYEILTAHC